MVKIVTECCSSQMANQYPKHISSHPLLHPSLKSFIWIQLVKPTEGKLLSPIALVHSPAFCALKSKYLQPLIGIGELMGVSGVLQHEAGIFSFRQRTAPLQTCLLFQLWEIMLVLHGTG